MRIGRTLPPAAAPLGFTEVAQGIRGMLRGQKELDRFRAELSEYFGVKHCFLVSSGKAAFALILLALKELHPGRDEVLIPAFTCFSVPSSIIHAGLKVKLCDLQPDSLDFDFAQLSELLTEATGPRRAGAGSKSVFRALLAVVPTHLFGFPADLPRLRGMIHDPEITIVEDAAQAMGEARDGRRLGTLGDVGFFSRGRGKAYSVVEGGVILTDRDDIAEHLDRVMERLPRYGLLPLLALIWKAAALAIFMRPGLFWVPRNLPFLRLGETLFDPNFPVLTMTSFQAGLAKNWRERLEKLGDGRKKNVGRLNAVLDTNRVSRSRSFNGHVPGLLRLPFRVKDRKRKESLLRESAANGLGIMPVYPTSIDAIPELRGKIGGGPFPVAESCAGELLTLPTHGYLTESDVLRISSLVSRVLG
jgi:dTDP-4-amino-4,6-dideoxygalactose transaminase